MPISWKNIRIKDYSIIKPIYYREGYGCYQTLDSNDQKCVIKVFDWEIIEDASAELRAARKLKSIDHPHLVRVYKVDKDTEVQVYYYVMEHWGEDLREIVKTPPRQDWIIEVIKQLLEGVSELHKHKLVHRDIKPENIFIKDGVVKLGDYGLVKSKRWITQLSTAGTPGYMPPEPRDARDFRWDIYSIGIVLMELLTGSREMPAKKPNNMPSNLWQVILKTTDKEPDKRFTSSQEFLEALSNLNLQTIHMADLIVPRKKKLSPTKQKKKVTTEPISQSLDIHRRMPDTDRSRRTIEPGILAKTLQTQFDEVIKTTDTQRALEIGGELLNAVEQRFGPKDPHVADVLDALAELNLRKGEYRSAWELYHRSSAIDTDAFGRPSREMIRSLFNEASVLSREGKFEEAIKTYQQALRVAEKIIGQVEPKMAEIAIRPQIAVLLNNLAGVYYRLKDYAKAEKLYQEALNINEHRFDQNKQNFIQDPESMAINLYNIALTYDAMDKKEAAQPLYHRAQEIMEKPLFGKGYLAEVMKERIILDRIKERLE